MKNYHLTLTLVVLFITMTSCYKKPVDGPAEEFIERFDQGIVIANYGSQQNGIGTFTYYDRENEAVIDDLYREQNDGRTIGNTIQSFTRFLDRGYVITGDRLIVIDLENFRQVREIDGFEMPRYFLGITSSKAYVSDWGDGFSGSVKVIDLDEAKIVKTIETDTKGPERMVRRGNNVYLANSGGFVADDRVTILDVSADKVKQHLTVGVDPIELQIDNGGNIWVLGKGIIDSNNPDNSKPGSLTKISNDQVNFKLELSNTISSLTINKAKDKLYFVMDGWVREFPITATSLGTAPYIDRFFFRIDIDPKTDQLYASDPKNYNNNGEVFIYDSAGNMLSSFKAGVVPGAFTFD